MSAYPNLYKTGISKYAYPLKMDHGFCGAHIPDLPRSLQKGNHHFDQRHTLDLEGAHIVAITPDAIISEYPVSSSSSSSCRRGVCRFGASDMDGLLREGGPDHGVYRCCVRIHTHDTNRGWAAAILKIG